MRCWKEGGGVLWDESVGGEGGPLVRPNDMRALLMQDDWWVRDGVLRYWVDAVGVGVR